MNMDYEVTFGFMKDCLRKWNYPQIHAMNEAQIAEIFSSSERPFLVSWLLKRLYPELLVDNQNYTVKQVISFVYDLGLCTERQKNKIFCTEFYEDQFEVLYKIFSVSDKVLSLPVIVKQKTKIRIEELENFNKVDLILFPCYGPMSVMTDEERESLKEKLEGNIQSVMQQKQTSDESAPDFHTLDTYSREMDEAMEGLRSSMPEFVNVSSSVCDNEEMIQGKNVPVNEDLESTVKKCGEQIEKLSQYFRDVETITEFAASADDRKPDYVPYKERDAFVILKNLAQQTKEVINSITLTNSKLEKT